MLGDIVSNGEAGGMAQLIQEAAPLRVRAYREGLGWLTADWRPRAERAGAWAADLTGNGPMAGDPADAAPLVDGLAGAGPGADGPGEVHPGLSPHAPYSTHPDFYDRLIALANAHALPLSTHGAESRIELDYLERGEGPLAVLRRDLGWDIEGPPLWNEGRGLADWLARREIRVPLQLVHGTHLAKDEFGLLGKLDCTVVYCPGSVAWFHGGRDPHPVEALLAAGVPVALGTDSLASSPSLNMPLTCTLAKRAQSGLEPEALLFMAQRAGALSLGFPDGGELRPGGRADFLLCDLLEAHGPDDDPSPPAQREAIEAALLSGYRVPSLHVFGGHPHSFASLQPFPA